MEKNDRINQIINHLTNAATAAADGMTDVVQSASKTVSTQYDKVKLNIEINRLHSEQNKIFSDIGRIMFLINSGAIDENKDTEKSDEMKETTESETPQDSQTENTEESDTSEPHTAEPLQEEDPQETISKLLILADQKQQEIDAATHNLSTIIGSSLCPDCGSSNDEKDAFCSSCGTKLS